ncbi:MAG: Tol-Pal system beta propeller repeat protein TolB [Candidatus Pelagadaptatus aseana]|uniref:Tol-Pal system beta propeller repeat protein TolB n=1 Tax=Candidatus Pelagadaptatus aseana TaxID=3120508 RepID=UPI0039B1B40B
MNLPLFRLWQLLLVLVCFTLSSQLRAELTIEITQGVDNPTRIAIAPFGWDGAALPENLDSIVESDLQRSGQFSTIPKRDMLSFPRREADVYYRDWRMLGSEYLLLANMEQTPEGEYQLTFELFDVLSQVKLLRKRVDGELSQLRDMAHFVSDVVYETITGIRGAFSTKIVYVEAFSSERYRLMMADADGARPRVLLKSKHPIMSPAWSPDGRQVAYVSFETGRPAIFRQELASGVREQLTNFKGLNGAPAWSPDGSKMALVLSKDGNPEIYVLDLATRKFSRITRHFAIDTEPNWTLDGKGVIFTSDRGGKPQIYQVTLASGRTERLTFEGDYNARPRLSPDGKHLVMVHRLNGVFHIAAQDMKTGMIRVLTETHLDESPSIAPNGAMLMYATKYRGKGILGAVSLDAGVKFRLPSKQGDVREPSWSPYF